MFKSLTRRPLWLNILAAIVFVLILFFIFMLSLDWITRHGESSTVPDVTGKHINDVTNNLESKGFEVVIQDSVYYDSLPRGIVIKQVPEADEVVKKNRTVYVTINRFLPPEIEMPSLVGYSLRNAEMTLRSLGLKLGDTTSRPDFAKNSVLEQLYQGRPIAKGTKIRMGSSIDLVLSRGLGDETMTVPQLLGLTYEEAKILTEAQGLLLVPVVIDPDVRDTSSAFIYEQRPESVNAQGMSFRVRQGQMLDVKLGLKRPNVDSIMKARRAPEPTEEELLNDQE